MSNFRVGQKVVCVSVPDFRPEQPNKPILGGIYTVRSVAVNHQGLPGIRLEEIRNPVGHFTGGFHDEPGFFAWRFRSVVDRKTDISVFKAMLKPSKTRVDA